MNVRATIGMATWKIGVVDSIATFRPDISRSEREAWIAKYQSADATGRGELKPTLTSAFAVCCASGLGRALDESDCMLRSLRIAGGSGWPEYHKDWLRLGCELFVDDAELSEAAEILQDEELSEILDVQIEAATDEFLTSAMRRDMFTELWCSVHLLQPPEKSEPR